MEPQSNSTNDCCSADWAQFKRENWNKNRRQGSNEKKDEWLCVGKGLNRCDVTSGFILGIWGASVNIYEHEHRF